MSEGKSGPAGLAGLPQPWGVAVQLVGTFGLAVFLVLYYVFVMQPSEAKRYSELASSVEELMEVVRERQLLVNRDQADRLEELFVEAAAARVTAVLLDARGASRGGQDLAREIENELMLRVDLLRGIRREGGGVLSEQLTNKLRLTGVPQRIAELAEGDWSTLPPEELALQTGHRLKTEIRNVARAK